MASSSDYVSLYGASLQWEPYEGGGVFGPMEEFGAADEIALNITDEDIKHISRSCGSVGIADKTALSSTEILMDIVSPEISPKMLSRAFRGVLTETPVSAALATEDQITVTTLGTYYDLSSRVITVNSVSCWDTAGQTGVEYTEGVDFNIDYDLGIFVAIVGGAITALSDVFVTFDNDAHTDFHIAAFKTTAATGRLTVKMCAVEGQTYLYVFEKVSLKLNGSFSMVNADDFVSIPLQATVLANTDLVDSSKSQTLNLYGGDKFVAAV